MEQTLHYGETETSQQHGRADPLFDEGAGSTVHDFRNLLQCATSALRVTRRRLATFSEADLAANVDDALEALHRANLLAQRLLIGAASRDEAHSVSVASLILSMRGILRHAVGDAVRLDTLVAESLMPLECDPIQLENVLVNLALNARDAMPDGGILIIQSRRCFNPEHAPHCMTLSVTDTGCGMSPDIADQATTAFFTTKPVGQGSGLGLSCARNFAERLGGSLEIRSTPGGGTCIRLHLPVSNGRAQRP